MTTVAQYFGHRQSSVGSPHPKLAFNANVGIELEIEEVNYLEVPYWNCTEDGSLRNGCELVCAQPYSGEDLYNAIDSLSTAVGNSSAQGTWRCSTHVHLDVRDCDSTVLKKIIVGWAFYERLLFKCSGFHRYRSNFCPAFAVVQAQLINAASAFNYDGERFFSRLVDNWDKYTSLNLLPLAQFGSVEFRVSEPKWKRTNLINLVNRYLTIKKLAVENRDMSLEQYVEFLKESGFGPMIEYLPLDYTINQEDLDFGYSLANDVISIRHESVQIVPRVRIVEAPSSTEVDEMQAPIGEMMVQWQLYANHVIGRSRNYRSEFVRIFGASSAQNIDVATVGQCRELIQSWSDIESENQDSTIRNTVIDGWVNSLDTFVSRL